MAQLDGHLTGEQEFMGMILAGSREIDHFYGHSLPSTDSRRAVVSFWQKNVQKSWLTP